LLTLAVVLLSGLMSGVERLGREIDGGAAPSAGWAREDLGALIGVVAVMPLAIGLGALLWFLLETGGTRKRRLRTVRKGAAFRRPRARTILIVACLVALPLFFWVVEFSPFGAPRTVPGPPDGDSFSHPQDQAGSILKLLLGRVPGLLYIFFDATEALRMVAELVPLSTLPLLALVVVQAAVAGILIARRRRDSHPRAPSVPPRPESAPERSLPDISFGSDVRSSIVRCFHEFCALLDRAGFTQREPLTPREIEWVATAWFDVPIEAADALTDLFERARYSTHPLEECDRTQAEALLGRIRGAFGGRRGVRSGHFAGPIRNGRSAPVAGIPTRA
jgi:hypothetical protein